MTETTNSPAQADLTDHSYDGIQEYDNPLPAWWTWLFAGSVIFSPFYWVYFHSGDQSRTVVAGYNMSVAENLKLQFAEIGQLQPDQDTLLKFMHDPKWIKVGELTFKTHCISCHGNNGEGKVGPNLTDDYWKNVTSLKGIASVIINGANNNAMPAWGNRLHPNEIVLVSAYVASLRGSDAGQNGKAAEGQLIPAWPEAPGEKLE